MRKNGRRFTHCAMATGMLLVTVVCTCPVAADKSSDAQLAGSVMRGLAHRLELVKALDCTVMYTGFDNPQVRNPNDKSPLVMAGLRTAIVDPTQDRWVVESRRIILNDTLTKDEVFARNGGVSARKEIRRRPVDPFPWMIDTQQEFGLANLLYEDALLLLSWSDDDLQQKTVSVSEELLDGAKCFRVVLRPRKNTPIRGDHYLWIDPAMGYALRKWCIAGVTNGRMDMGYFRHGYDFREYAPGVWMPQRVQQVKMTAPAGGGKLQWDGQETYKVLQMKVNQPVPDDLFASLVFKGEFPSNPYETRLGEKTEIVCENSPQSGMTEKIAVDLLLSRLYEHISKAPDDMSGFLEALPQ